MSIAIVTCLFLHYAATMTIFGASGFRLLTPSDQGRAIDATLHRVLVAIFALALISAVAMLQATAASMGGAWAAAIDPQTVGAVLLETSFGKVWQWHLGLAVITGIALLRTRAGRPWITILAGLLLASLALVGHAAMVEGVPGALRRLNQAVHLLAGGAWLGGLLPLALILFATRSKPHTAIPILHRFSVYGTGAVALLLVTGVINTAALVERMRGLVDSPYGWTLLTKLALVAGMIAIAFVNRFHLTPHLGADSDTAARRLRRSIALEIGVGLAVVLVASLLGTLAPPNG